MDDILKVAAGYPLVGIALVMVWRVMREYRTQMEFWRAKALDLLDKGNTASEALEAAVDDDVEGQEKWKKVVDIVLEREKRANGGGK